MLLLRRELLLLLLWPEGTYLLVMCLRLTCLDLVLSKVLLHLLWRLLLLRLLRLHCVLLLLYSLQRPLLWHQLLLLLSLLWHLLLLLLFYCLWLRLLHPETRRNEWPR